MGLLESVEFRYPEKLVSEYGAKAGLLMHVARLLPEIPQMPMVVSRIGEPAGDFLTRVDQAGIGRSIIFRSSAREELVGFEGAFPTRMVEMSEGEDKNSRYLNIDGDEQILDTYKVQGKLEDLVREIAYSPRKMANCQLSPEINVIAAPLAPCRYTGTLIKHPNREDYYLTTLHEAVFYKDIPRAQLTLTYNSENKFLGFGRRNIIKLTDILEEQLETVIGWHDDIAKILDPRWIYVIEYGLMPATLFQVHYFKPIQKARFKFDARRDGSSMPIVMGVTDRKGEDYELALSGTRHLETSLPVLYSAGLHGFWNTEYFKEMIGKEPQGVVFWNAGGVLVHRDVAALRRSKLALIYPGLKPDELNRGGMIVNLVSDGRQVRITDKLTGKQIF